MNRLIKIAITTGDPDGIGFEVVSKALARVKPKTDIQLYLWRAPSASKKDLRRIDSTFRRRTVSSWPEALKESVSGNKDLVDISSNLSPAHWVEISAQAAKLGHIDGIATAPLSKTAIQAAGMKDIGHTDILKRVAKANDLFMTFVGKKFSVVLATGHISLDRVAGHLDEKCLEGAIRAAQELKSLLPSKDKRGVAVLGLNPHAGEEGIIGKHEQEVHNRVVERLKGSKIPVEGPLVPDAAFSEENWEKYAVFVANYHDQGLIPYKLIHKRQGVHMTMGLPFVRTSVDHGTAKDIFGKDKADYHSMLEALKWAVDMCRAKRSEDER
ncbi:MAG TPA: 4-hydroxythreonine-4-phosphate dehydrogenase PdxA [Bdellovibrionales bacterium]|nr:4-hydroxythreonine-4-phosphate dehydrogenase PdxA [Bdellovibrionales bacterium]